MREQKEWQLYRQKQEAEAKEARLQEQREWETLKQEREAAAKEARSQELKEREQERKEWEEQKLEREIEAAQLIKNNPHNATKEIWRSNILQEQNIQ